MVVKIFVIFLLLPLLSLTTRIIRHVMWCGWICESFCKMCILWLSNEVGKEEFWLTFKIIYIKRYTFIKAAMEVVYTLPYPLPSGSFMPLGLGIPLILVHWCSLSLSKESESIVYASMVTLSCLSELQKDVFERRTSTGSNTFAWEFVPSPLPVGERRSKSLCLRSLF